MLDNITNAVECDIYNAMLGICHVKEFQIDHSLNNLSCGNAISLYGSAFPSQPICAVVIIRVKLRQCFVRWSHSAENRVDVKT